MDAALFAFGAQGLDDQGRIINPKENPLSHFDEYNTTFMSALEAEIAKNPKLKATPFTKINAHTFSIISLIATLKSAEEIEKEKRKERKKKKKKPTNEKEAVELYVNDKSLKSKKAIQNHSLAHLHAMLTLDWTKFWRTHVFSSSQKSGRFKRLRSTNENPAFSLWSADWTTVIDLLSNGSQ